MTDVRKATDTHSQLENVGNYELMRQQNIQRNLEMMKVLGLNKLQEVTKPTSNTMKETGRQKKDGQKRKELRKVQWVRRSERARRQVLPTTSTEKRTKGKTKKRSNEADDSDYEDNDSEFEEKDEDYESEQFSDDNGNDSDDGHKKGLKDQQSNKDDKVYNSSSQSVPRRVSLLNSLAASSAPPLQLPSGGRRTQLRVDGDGQSEDFTHELSSYMVTAVSTSQKLNEEYQLQQPTPEAAQENPQQLLHQSDTVSSPRSPGIVVTPSTPKKPQKPLQAKSPWVVRRRLFSDTEADVTTLTQTSLNNFNSPNTSSSSSSSFPSSVVQSTNTNAGPSNAHLPQQQQQQQEQQQQLPRLPAPISSFNMTEKGNGSDESQPPESNMVLDTQVAVPDHSQIRAPRVVFLDEKVQQRFRRCIEALGGVILPQNNLAQATHVVASEINFFSLTLMSSLAFVNFIVTPRWLEASETNRAFVDEQEYILEDHVKQSMLNFNLKSALSIPKQQRRKLFKGYCFHLVGNLFSELSTIQELSLLVRAYGGMVVRIPGVLFYLQANSTMSLYNTFLIFKDEDIIQRQRQLVHIPAAHFQNPIFVLRSILSQQISSPNPNAPPPVPISVNETLRLHKQSKAKKKEIKTEIKQETGVADDMNDTDKQSLVEEEEEEEEKEEEEVSLISKSEKRKRDNYSNKNNNNNNDNNSRVTKRQKGGDVATPNSEVKRELQILPETRVAVSWTSRRRHKKGVPLD